MKSKKLVAGFTVLAFSALVLGACSADKKDDSAASSSAKTEQTTASSSAAKEEAAKVIAGGEMKDGTYKLEEKNYSNGYRATFEITVKDGKITESKYDNINEAGKSKTEDADYNKQMKDKAGISPEEFIPKFNEELVAAQDPSSMDVVTGATHSFESFQNYAQQLIQAAQAGKTDTIEIDNGAELKDGTYALKEKNDKNGYHVDFSIVVKDGKITESKYDNLNADGKSKKDDADYEKNMKDKSGVGPKEYIEDLNKNFLAAMGKEDGSPADMDVVTGATHSSHTFIIYAEQLINAAEKGDTTPIEVDNIVTE
ncbi:MULTISPECIES: extracellular electron transfer flavoprotein PplA [Enterococcus]|uniref:extracellular electron transfer flavoprotein PplA n=1 Tax=Enterococcus TaxID=1350 RepID=UPI001E5FE206|nr:MULTISPECIES: extracellular electron transfer flavoprotein PplA [Enterococcus]MCD1025513.1 FMN-binding protein [Enterococcus sp. SMC-9]MDT2739293.1 FMN-binding protein [Enterococcus canintestini]WHA09350.1 FMN-binding protein [Enterococcus montenegrensis]